MITRRLFGFLLGAAPFAAKIVEPAKADTFVLPAPLAQPEEHNAAIKTVDGVTERWLADYHIHSDEMLARVDFKVGPLAFPKRAIILSNEQIAALKAEFAESIAEVRQLALAKPGSQYNVLMVLNYHKHGPCTEQQDWAHT